MSEVQVESQQDLTTSKGDSALVDIWTREIESADKNEKTWRAEAAKYLDIYKDQHGNNKRYNIFWANTQTLRPLVFSKLPDPNITRRYLDKDEDARIASEMMERAVSYCLEDGDVKSVFNKVRDDFLICGRGISRVVYDPGEIVEISKKTIDEEGNEIESVEEDVDYSSKKVRVEYVKWEDFRISPETVWEDVRWIAFRHKMTREQLVDKFGSIGSEVNLTQSSIKTEEGYVKDESDLFKFAEVWEVWDKNKREVVWLTTGLAGQVLSKDEDPYNLDDFFCISKPLGCDSDPSSLIPVPLYRMYKSQAEELNEIDDRIRSLVEQVKYTGVYNSIAEGSDIENLLNGDDGEFSPLKGVQPGSNIKDAIFTKPIVDIINTIAQLNDQKARVINNIRDITGLSDIVRGTSFASETATAQRLKGDFAISRIQPLQEEVEINIRNTIRLMAELIVENYSAVELAKMTNLKIVDIQSIQEVAAAKQNALLGEAQSLIDPQDPEAQQKMARLQQEAAEGMRKTLKKPLEDLKGYAVTPEQLEKLDVIIKNDRLRDFSIDIETESTVRVDQSQEKQDRIEFVNAVTSFSSALFPLLQNNIINKSAFNEFLGFISRPFKVGRNLEEFLVPEEEEEAPQQPSAEEILAQAENQRRDLEMQLKAQEVDIKQQEVNIKKAELLQDQIQFEDKIEFEDVNKEADRRAKSADQLAKVANDRVSNLIRESDLV